VVLARQQRRPELERHLADLAGEAERHLIVLVVNRRAGINADIESCLSGFGLLEFFLSAALLLAVAVESLIAFYWFCWWFVFFHELELAIGNKARWRLTHPTLYGFQERGHDHRQRSNKLCVLLVPSILMTMGSAICSIVFWNARTGIGLMMATKVFISYRREDAAGHAGRVHDRLVKEFGANLLFMDVDGIPLGVNFVKALQEEVAKCGVLLAVIGPDWLTVRDKDGQRRVDNPNDYVRVEIATALQREIPVIPILLEGTPVPSADQLPKDLQELSLRNGINVRHSSFHSDMDRLIRGLKSKPAEQGTWSQSRMEPDSVVVTTIGPLIASVIGAAIGWLTGGSSEFIGQALTSLLAIVGAISGLAFSLMYRRYLGVLGAGGGRKGYPAREAYDRLRENLSGGNLAARIYADRLGAFLDAVDRFFGDAGMADRTLFPHAFGLRTPAPLWTAPAFDRCLLLALIYPIATILVIWAVSGHVGPAEAALHLKSDLPGWQRGLAVVIVGVAVIAVFRSARLKGWIAWFWFAGAMILAVFAGVVSSSLSAIEIAGIGGTAVASFLVVIVARIVILGTSEPSVYLGYDIGYIGLGVVSVIGVVVIAIAVAVGISVDFPVLARGLGIIATAGAVAVLSDLAMKYRYYGLFLTLLFPAAVMACLWAAELLSPLGSWHRAGPLLLFLGLLTLINAPFNWASLGLTRALLRRGLEIGGWSPYLLAIVDAILAAGIVVLLVFAMVIAVQCFDHLAEHGGGAGILPLDPLLTGIAENPAAPEYWWIYALLLSTMIPSFINLMIGGSSLARGVPGVPLLLLRFMPAGRAVATFERNWIALLLTVQVFLGAFCGIMAQVLLAVGVISYVMPSFGLRLLDTARDLAALDLPMQVLGLFWGTS
jgi:TIR domain